LGVQDRLILPGREQVSLQGLVGLPLVALGLVAQLPARLQLP